MWIFFCVGDIVFLELIGVAVLDTSPGTGKCAVAPRFILAVGEPGLVSRNSTGLNWFLHPHQNSRLHPITALHCSSQLHPITADIKLYSLLCCSCLHLTHYASGRLTICLSHSIRVTFLLVSLPPSGFVGVGLWIGPVCLREIREIASWASNQVGLANASTLRTPARAQSATNTNPQPPTPSLPLVYRYCHGKNG